MVLTQQKPINASPYSLESWVNSKHSSYLLPLITTVLLFIVWEISVRLFSVPEFILPAPSAILAEIPQWGRAVAKNAWITLATTLVGFSFALLSGVLIGFTIGYSKLANLTIYPLLIGFNTIPKVALVPLMSIWFGIGAVPAVITAFLLAFFPIAVNVAIGLATVESEMQDVLTSLGASRFEGFQKVGFPHTMPYLFASLKVAISQAFIGSVIAETVASNGGIGYVILSASSNFNVPLAFLALLALAVMGIFLYSIFMVLEKRFVHWI
ncbi:MAG: NitT/TauT family transport system permease protein [Phormidesmis priestleyi Ana]|uniref:NitT/TauT family transport system permease protein n=1 Tax=Phormidesmis priestleyi Ana TaxID=1666911 RepID=A0A0P7ZP74_9CYAN|nr:MAG: NitT/TauT family transport system permease protein [Phormidesmis priestleyi Ana]